MINPQIMVSEQQYKYLKKMGYWKEPVMRPSDWPETMVEEALKKEVKKLKKDQNVRRSK